MFSSEIYKAIVAISVKTTQSPNFGTGFVIDQYQDSTYILTARHTLLQTVADNRGELCQPSDIDITYRRGDIDMNIAENNNNQDKVLEIIDCESFDLAVIKLNYVWDCQPLTLNLFSGYDDSAIQLGDSFYVTGYYKEEETQEIFLAHRELKVNFWVMTTRHP